MKQRLGNVLHAHLCEKVALASLYCILRFAESVGDILHGNHEGEWEAHIKPDWLLVWEQNDDELTLLMLTTGTHSDVFGKTRR